MAKVLIVDDAAFTRMRCNRLLTHSGYDVVEASDGNEGLQKYQEDDPDAVLLDITMPNKDGLSTLKELMTMDPCARVAMLTVMGQKSMVMASLKLGARDFVVKPFETERLLSSIKRILQ
jgi:two-component system chemotaxis response regulator CheY